MSTAPVVGSGGAAEPYWHPVRQPPELSVRVPNEALAEALLSHLQPMQAEAIAADGHYEVGVELREANSEQRVVKALRSIDDWLLASRLPSVRIHLDGISHTLHPLPGPSSAGGGATGGEPLVR